MAVVLRTRICGRTLTICTIEHDGTDHVERFLREAHEREPDALERLFFNLYEVAENGPIENEYVYRPLRRSLIEIRTGILRIIFCEWHDELICTHGFFKSSQRTPTEEIKKGVWLRSELLMAEQTKTLTRIKTDQWKPL